MWRRSARSTTLGLLLHTVLVLTGCASKPSSFETSPTAFPPQQVMEDGNYVRFLAENRQLLERCQGGSGCEMALFNLGFVHAYPPSPYHDPGKALQYFDDLIKKYPQTPWAFEGRAWRALLTANLASEEKRRRLQADLRAKDATIRTLRTQLGRSREIDMEIDKKERELLR
jgi:hypothetical protein